VIARRPPSGTVDPPPRISVVIPTCRRADLLRRCLDALIAQRIDPRKFEVIVVDDGREDRIRNMVLGLGEWLQAPQVRYLRPLHGHGPAAARNRGWRAARGAVIAFTDDDTIPMPDWLAQGARAFEANRHWVAFSGRVVVPRAEAARAPTDHERMTRGLEGAEFVTANAFVWRTALEAIGGFDERFTRAWREDFDLQFRLLATGGSVGHAPDARVVHPVRAERWGVSLRQQRDTYFDALLYKKHPRLYRERIRPVPPWDYYLIVGCVGAAPLLWLLDAPHGAVVCLGCALALVGIFAWRRLQPADHSMRHAIEVVATSLAIPFLSVYWRVRGALRFRVPFF
jgi:GT2 family glycosyltransferase